MIDSCCIHEKRLMSVAGWLVLTPRRRRRLERPPPGLLGHHAALPWILIASWSLHRRRRQESPSYSVRLRHGDYHAQRQIMDDIPKK